MINACHLFVILSLKDWKQSKWISFLGVFQWVCRDTYWSTFSIMITEKRNQSSINVLWWREAEGSISSLLSFFLSKQRCHQSSCLREIFDQKRTGCLRGIFDQRKNELRDPPERRWSSQARLTRWSFFFLLCISCWHVIIRTRRIARTLLMKVKW